MNFQFPQSLASAPAVAAIRLASDSPGTRDMREPYSVDTSWASHCVRRHQKPK